MSNARIVIYDTTLRDGSQTEGISFSVNDKIKITEKLDDLGIHYIEGGWPGSNPKDEEYFKAMLKKKLKNAKLAAFGSTRRAGIKAADDVNLKALVASKAPTVTIFGKTWDLHVTDIIKTTLDENLKMIADSVSFLKKHGLEVFYDAEHFFDGYKRNPEYALKTILAAQGAGADCIVFCDTNGGTLPEEVAGIIEEIKPHIKAQMGIHTHNDMDLAVANSLAAIEAGATQVQGTFNGLGERCGNADLCTIIGILHTKMDRPSIPDAKVKHLMEASYFLSEISNVKLPDNHAFVGHSAFAHKGGVHIDAILKNPLAYEHIKPELVGNRTRLLTSELAGKMPIVLKAKQMGIDIDKKSPDAIAIMKILQEKENEGYQFEAADASFELFIKRHFKKYSPFFELNSFKVEVSKEKSGAVSAIAVVTLTVNKGPEFISIDTKNDTLVSSLKAVIYKGDGPIDALDKALRAELSKHYPSLSSMHLSDYKVRVLNVKKGTAAKVRVLIESQDTHDSWTTIGVHENIIEASWEALVDSIEYKLLKDKKKS